MMQNYKNTLLAEAVNRVVGHAMGNIKYKPDVNAHYEFILSEGSENLIELVQSILKARGVPV